MTEYSQEDIIVEHSEFQNIISRLEDVKMGHSDESLLELEIEKNKFSLTSLSHSIESEGFQILFFWKEDIFDRYKISLLINSQNLKSIIGMLENQGYTISGSINEREHDEMLHERYEHLMRFIDI